MMRESIAVEKAKAFAIRIIRMYQWLNREKREFILSKQCLRSGTSIGANLSEGLSGQSRADFLAKLHIALKESYETEYWLDLLHETDYISKEIYESLHEDCIELVKILTATIKTTKSSENN